MPLNTTRSCELPASVWWFSIFLLKYCLIKKWIKSIFNFFVVFLSMSSADRYLNAQYDSLIAEVEITGISRLGGVKSAIKLN